LSGLIPHAERQRAIVIAANKNRPLSAEHKAKISLNHSRHNKGKKDPVQSKRMKENNPMLRPEVAAKSSASHKGKTHSGRKYPQFSIRMTVDNPMRRPDVVDRVKATKAKTKQERSEKRQGARMINDGVINRVLFKGQSLPVGFTYGQIRC
jgi:hypothetical protein